MLHAINITFGFNLLMDDAAIKRLLKIIEDQLGWGNPETWASRDFEELNIIIQEKTKVSLSSSTLRRLWGKADYKNQPSLTTLNTLAQFAGFENWKKYSLSSQPYARPEIKVVRPFKVKRLWLIVSGLALAVFITLIIVTIVKPADNSYKFSFHPITHDLPNTVVFSYNAQSASNDSVFIQQSWDSTKRTRVSKDKHLFNSIYYKPGFYHAKLTVGNRVVKEHPLLIPTNEWLGLIDQKPVPVYLDKQEILTKDGIVISSSTIASHHIAVEPQPPTVEVYNTGNFKPVPINNFSFSAEVKNDYKTGASRCQQMSVVLFTNDMPISIPLSAPGCVASLNLLDGHQGFRGTDTDLSGFGIDPSTWVKIDLTSYNDKIKIKINDREVFTINARNRSSEILGMGFIFHGTAGIRKVNLTSGNRNIFSDFN